MDGFGALESQDWGKIEFHWQYKNDLSCFLSTTLKAVTVRLSYIVFNSLALGQGGNDFDNIFEPLENIGNSTCSSVYGSTDPEPINQSIKTLLQTVQCVTKDTEPLWNGNDSISAPESLEKRDRLSQESIFESISHKSNGDLINAYLESGDSEAH